MSQKLATAARSRKSAQRLYLREKSLRSKNPSLVSATAAISAETRKVSEYARQLREKQKVRRLYGVPEGQFKKYYKNATKSTGNTALHLLQMLEQRLDNVVYRSGFAASRAQARQLVGHGWIKVNGTVINIPSYSVREHQVVSPNKKHDMFAELLFDNTPAWIKVEKKKMEAHIESEPTREDIDPDINEQLIVEFYSR